MSVLSGNRVPVKCKQCAANIRNTQRLGEIAGPIPHAWRESSFRPTSFFLPVLVCFCGWKKRGDAQWGTGCVCGCGTPGTQCCHRGSGEFLMFFFLLFTNILPEWRGTLAQDFFFNVPCFLFFFISVSRSPYMAVFHVWLILSFWKCVLLCFFSLNITSLLKVFFIASPKIPELVWITQIGRRGRYQC